MQRTLQTQQFFRKIILFTCALFCLHFSLCAQDSTQTKFKPSGKLWGYAFGDYAYKVHADKAERGTIQYSNLPGGYHSFNLRRVYLGYDFRLSPGVSTQLLLAHESTAEGIASNPDEVTNGNRGVYIKAINIRFENIIPRATIIAGQQATPTFSTLSETVWGYRSVEKTIADIRGISSSTDLGLGIFGKVGQNENVGYDIMVGNNNGAKPVNNQFKKLYTSLYAFFLDKKLIVQGNFETGTIAVTPMDKRFTTFKLFAGYKSKVTSVGIEAFRRIQTHSSIFVKTIGDTTYASRQTEGISLFFTQQIKSGKLKLFARYDIYNPDAAYIRGNHYPGNYPVYNESFATLGLDYIPFENVHIIPNFWCNRYQGKLPGVISDYDLVGRITLYFIFNK